MAPVIQITGEKPDIDCKFTESKLQNSFTLQNFDKKLDHLSRVQSDEIGTLIADFPNQFGNVPRRTHLMQHDVVVVSDTPIRQHPYRVNPKQLQIILDEVQYMLDNEMIEPSDSE